MFRRAAGNPRLVYCIEPWRKKEEILPLLMEAEANEPQKQDLKPLPVELKYAYLEENEQCLVVISSLLSTS